MEILTDSLDSILSWLKTVNWFDITMLLLLATSIALFAQKRLAGFLIGILAPVLLRPLLTLSERDALLAVAFGLLAGAALGFIAQIASPRLRWSNRSETILGGLGGLSFGLCFILAIVLSFPLNINPLNNKVTYPYLKSFPESFPTSISNSIKSSHIVNIGRDTLLYKAYKDPSLISSTDPDLVRVLNRWLIISAPWEKPEPIKTESENGT